MDNTGELNYGLVGTSPIRVDGRAKVDGSAKFTDDFIDANTLHAKVLHSTIANGLVTAIDVSAARSLEGVVKVVTCLDVPEIDFPTAGHPWSTDAGHQDIADRRLLNKRVRYYGDDIAAVVATTPLIAQKACELIKVTYDQYPALLDAKAALEGRAIHDGRDHNILKEHSYDNSNDGSGDSYEKAASQDGLTLFTKTYTTQMVQHCHLEPPTSVAYGDGDKVVVIASTQIPHIMRRVIAQALGLPWGRVRVIKPYLGGGFGNKQDVLYEPLNAYLCMILGGKRVKLQLTREETFANTRVRHAIEFTITAAVKPDGRFVARKLDATSLQGAYASHGHSIVANAATAFRQIYLDEKATAAHCKTVYANTPTAGAMRGYGIPQICFAMESFMDDLAQELGMDPIELRRKNMIYHGYKDPNGTVADSNGLEQCIALGAQKIDWQAKRKQYANQSGNFVRGVGMAAFIYKSCVYPVSLEVAGCRMNMNQDGSVQLQMGATEIGQGADTVFCQMAAQTLGIPFEDVHIVSTQDTDVTPYDSGAYASRQTYVGGMAVKLASTELREKVLSYAKTLYPAAEDIKGRSVVDASGLPVASLEDVAMEAHYSLTDTSLLCVEVKHQCKNNAFSFGTCFVEIELDKALGKVKVLRIINVHDSGKLINPKLAEAQVHGGMSMGLGYALSEEIKIDPKTGRMLNDNLLDYKLPTAIDTPELEVYFVETDEKTGPYGNKALGEPPSIPVAPAIRNAILCATGAQVDDLPLTPHKLYSVVGGERDVRD